MTETTGALGAPRRVMDLPAQERPRERLACHGASALSNRELLALLVGTGSRGASALDLAEGLAASGLRDLAGQSLGERSEERRVGKECRL